MSSSKRAEAGCCNETAPAAKRAKHSEIQVKAIVHHEQPDGQVGEPKTFEFQGVNGSFEEMCDKWLKNAVYQMVEMEESIKTYEQGGEDVTQGTRQWLNTTSKANFEYTNVDLPLMHMLHTFMHDALHKLSYNLQAVKSCTTERPDLYCMTGPFDFNRFCLIKVPVTPRGNQVVKDRCAWCMPMKDFQDSFDEMGLWKKPRSRNESYPQGF